MLREFKKRQIEKERLNEYDNGGPNNGAEDMQLGPHLGKKENSFSNLNFLRNEEFFFIVIDKGMTTLVTSTRRVFSFRYMVYCGNMNGIIGYGNGKASEMESAMEKAYTDCQRNLISLDQCTLNPWPREIFVRFCRLDIYFVPFFKLNSWGNPIFLVMMQLAGADGVRWRDSERNWNKYSMVYGMFQGLCRNKTLQTLGEEEGLKKFNLGVRRGSGSGQNNTEIFR